MSKEVRVVSADLSCLVLELPEGGTLICWTGLPDQLVDGLLGEYPEAPTQDDAEKITRALQALGYGSPDNLDVEDLDGNFVKRDEGEFGVSGKYDEVLVATRNDDGTVEFDGFLTGQSGVDFEAFQTDYLMEDLDFIEPTVFD